MSKNMNFKKLDLLLSFLCPHLTFPNSSSSYGSLDSATIDTYLVVILLPKQEKVYTKKIECWPPNNDCSPYGLLLDCSFNTSTPC
ncbi:hypothetical protein BH18THE2_BH18THE2_43050 [soil metagenome]